MQQLQTRLSQMGRQVSVVRNVEHVCGEVVRKEVVNKRPVSPETDHKQTRNHSMKLADDEPRIDLHDAETEPGAGWRSGTVLLY